MTMWTRKAPAAGRRAGRGGPKGRAESAARIFLLLACLGLAAGCASVGPDYVAPAVDVPRAWSSTAAAKVAGPDMAAASGKDAMVVQWWRLFRDPVLERLVAEAAQRNLDLREAVARVDEAEARLGVASGGRLPSVDASGAYARKRTSENAGGDGLTTHDFSVGGAAGWEADLFGRVRRSVEAAAAEHQASREDRAAVMISLHARVALRYLAVRTCQARLVAARANIDSQREVLELSRARLRHGLTNDLDVAQAERMLASSEASVPPLRIALAEAVNGLAVLLARPPGPLHEELAAGGPIPVPPDRATLGVPADLMRRRPDIRQAERLLAAQTARVGVATADLYPRLSLAGSLGYEAYESRDLFDPASTVFAFGPSLRWNIFAGGSLRSRVRVEDARVQQCLCRYERTVLAALAEVETALRAYVEERARLDALRRTVDASRRSVRLSVGLYRQGLVDFQSVLDSQRDLFSFENQLAAARGDCAANFVRLYTALGGGWDPEAPQEPGAPDVTDAARGGDSPNTKQPEGDAR
ncbi:MAG: efflux transporter outer membrane subunit [Desulfovibrionaceae bacterium]|jgi:NodT family efflux transporter outer membrane factor (OMF) lipoprotein|nr:efflux transporter outer membrane subunit [Desulfovibrionaceae bacterium]